MKASSFNPAGRGHERFRGLVERVRSHETPLLSRASSLSDLRQAARESIPLLLFPFAVRKRPQLAHEYHLLHLRVRKEARQET